MVFGHLVRVVLKGFTVRRLRGVALHCADGVLPEGANHVLAERLVSNVSLVFLKVALVRTAFFKAGLPILDFLYGSNLAVIIVHTGQKLKL